MDIMEQLADWYLAHALELKRFPSRLMIRRKARALAGQKSTFKASDSWIDNFMKRTAVRQKA